TAHAHALCMEKGRPGETYIVAGPVHTLIDALETAERLTGIPAPPPRPPAGVVRALAAVMSLVEKVVPLPETMTGEGLRSIAGVTYTGSHEKASRELGYEPRPLEGGLRLGRTPGVPHGGTTERATRELGYEPRPLEVGLRETLDHEMRLLGIAP